MSVLSKNARSSTASVVANPTHLQDLTALWVCFGFIFRAGFRNQKRGWSSKTVAESELNPSNEFSVVSEKLRNYNAETRNRGISRNRKPTWPMRPTGL